ncbi:MAG TPA: hypothetical protein VJA17_04365, partial [Candidatus Omnitrophota bacterium]|nr:hypothetical protein [Candidatus Omnitrophota bacterium]
MKKNQTIAFVIFILIHISILSYFHNRFWCAADDGEFSHVAQRLNNGEVLFRDVQDSHPGYIHWLNALSMRIFGEDFVSLRYPVTTVFFVIGCLVFFVFSSHNLGLAMVAGFCPTVLDFVHYINPNHHWYALFFTILIAVVLSRDALDKHRQSFIVGVLIATVYLFRQLTGVFVSMAVITFFLLEASEKRAAQGKLKDSLLFYFLTGLILVGMVLYLLRRTDIFGFFAFGVWPLLLTGWMFAARFASNKDLGERLKYFLPGIVAGLLPLFVQQLLQGTLGAWFEHSVIRALQTYQHKFLSNYNYAVLWLAAWRNIFTPQNFLQIVNSFYWIILFSFSIVNGVLLFFYGKRLERKNTRMIALPVLASFYAIVAVHFQIPVYLYFTAGFSATAVLWWMIVLKPRAWIQGLVAGGVSLMMAVALYCHAAQPLTRSFYFLLSGIKFPAVWAANDLKRTHLWIDREDFAVYTRIMEVVEERSKKDESIFVLPYNPEIYFMSGRKNIFPFFVSDFQSQKDYSSIRAQLEQT